MAQIIKPGRTMIAGENTVGTWPIGQQMTCFNCHCEWKIEKGDSFEAALERHLDGMRTVSARCPECETLNVSRTNAVWVTSATGNSNIGSLTDEARRELQRVIREQHQGVRNPLDGPVADSVPVPQPQQVEPAKTRELSPFEIIK